MPSIRALTISVGYATELAITLPRNMRHFTEILVVTSPKDEATQAVARSVPGVRLLITSVFTEPGSNGVVPRFNKGRAMNAGFDALGRDNWLCVLDADILLPDSLPLDRLKPTHLHGARRRILEDASAWTPDLDWSTCPIRQDGGAPIGYLQIFHADAIRDKVLWYEPTFTHAGGGDAYFMSHWPRNRWASLPMECLHLGPCDRHWFGRDAEGIDMMAAYVHRNGWTQAAAKHDRSALDRVGEIAERVTIPGVEDTGYQLPFVRRAKDRAEQEARRAGRP